jgi:hypothetical protein
MLGGLFIYNYLTLDMPGAKSWLDGRGFQFFLQAVIFGQGLGFAAGWLWRLMTERGNQADEQHKGTEPK